ncbi:hypothetical protein BH23GEM9_BH23GEM9_11140 [soil metagenome]
MEMLVIAVVAIVAFGAVLIPLFRRSPYGRDPDEFGGGGSAAGPEAGRGVIPPMAAGPATPMAPPGSAAGSEPEPGATSATSARRTDAEVPAAEAYAEDEVELEVQRYRAALRAGTICSKCGQANPADSSFCFDCGAQLPLTEAREFD